MSSPLKSAPIDDVTTALLELLRTGGRTVYDAAYAGNPLQPTYPYDIVYQLPGGSADPMPDLDADYRPVVVVFQVTTVSNLRNQCQRSAARARDLIVGRNPTGELAYELPVPAGWRCDRWPDPAMPGVDRVGAPPSAVFNQAARYLLALTPEETP